jgi:hypothetical protein
MAGFWLKLSINTLWSCLECNDYTDIYGVLYVFRNGSLLLALLMEMKKVVIDANRRHPGEEAWRTIYEHVCECCCCCGCWQYRQPGCTEQFVRYKGVDACATFPLSSWTITRVPRASSTDPHLAIGPAQIAVIPVLVPTVVVVATATKWRDRQ